MHSRSPVSTGHTHTSRSSSWCGTNASGLVASPYPSFQATLRDSYETSPHSGSGVGDGDGVVVGVSVGVTVPVDVGVSVTRRVGVTVVGAAVVTGTFFVGVSEGVVVGGSVGSSVTIAEHSSSRQLSAFSQALQIPSPQVTATGQSGFAP